jgi:hypothetical protein
MSSETQFAHILGFFDGRTARMAEVTGHSESTLGNWRRAGTIPQKYHLGIIIAAREAGITIMPHEFTAHLLVKLIGHIEGAQA